MLPPQANSAPSHPALPVALQELEVGGGAGYAGRISTYSLGSTMVGGVGRRGQTCPVKEQRRGGSRLTLLLHQREGKTLGPRFQKNS